MKRNVKIGLSVSSAAIVLAAAALALVNPERWGRDTYVCSRCRALKQIETRWGNTTERIERTEYSHWYLPRHPEHQHKWLFFWGSSELLLGQIRLTDGFPGIRHIPCDLQRHFVESARPEEIERFYSLIESGSEEDHTKALDTLLDVWEQAPPPGVRNDP